MNSQTARNNLVILIKEAENILATRHFAKNIYGDGLSSVPSVDGVAALEWYTNGLLVLRSIFGENSEHYRSAANEARESYFESAQRFQAVLKAALTALDRGYLVTMRELLRADVEKTLIEQADDLLDGNYYQPAAVLAGAVLEHHLRSICAAHGVSELKPDGKPKTLDPINNELAKAGAYDGITQKLITHLASIRNAAAHGNSVTPDDAKRIVAEVLSLCARLR